ncbi:MAG: class I SAM-dependent methyltransferase [Pseudomonadota bacterium]
MGINYASFLHLADLSRRFAPTGRTVMLGRQKFDLRVNRWISRWHFSLALKKAGIDKSIRDFAQSDRYAETMFRELGLGKVEALDASEFEGAGLVWDLNAPIPDEWRGQFHLVVDGGTLEHVFDVAQAFDNVVEMLAPGGRFVSFTPFNGYPGHGFYQFSPEVVWTYWKSTRGFKVHKCHVSTPKGEFSRDLIDTRELGKRIQFDIGPSILGRFPARRLLMCYEVEKPISAPNEEKRPALQSDYETRWASAR